MRGGWGPARRQGIGVEARPPGLGSRGHCATLEPDQQPPLRLGRRRPALPAARHGLELETLDPSAPPAGRVARILAAAGGNLKCGTWRIEGMPSGSPGGAPNRASRAAVVAWAAFLWGCVRRPRGRGH